MASSRAGVGAGACFAQVFERECAALLPRLLHAPGMLTGMASLPSRSLANPLVELLRQQVHGGAPAAPPHPQPSRKSKAKAGACSHVAAGPSGLEALLQGMLQQAGIAEQEPVASLAVGLADHEQQQRLQASCQLPPTSQQQLEQRAQGLQHLLMGIKALQFALGAHGFTPLSACASASTAVPSQQEVPQPGAAATTSRQGPDTLNAPGALRGQVQAVLSFMVNTLTTLAPSELRKTYMRYSVDLLATLLSPTDAGGASSYGSSSLHDKGLSGRGGAAASQEVAHALQLAGPSLLASLAMLDCAGAASGASVPVASAAGAAATAAAKHRRPCNGSRQQGLGSVGVLVLDAVGLLLDRSMPCSPNPSTHDLHGPHISQGSAWACDPSVPTSSPSPALVSRPDAAQALLQHMVAASPLLGQLVMVACAAALHRSTAQLVQALSPAAQAGQAREANGSGMAASRSMLLAGAATEFEAAHFRFSLLVRISKQGQYQRSTCADHLLVHRCFASH